MLTSFSFLTLTLAYSYSKLTFRNACITAVQKTKQKTETLPLNVKTIPLNQK